MSINNHWRNKQLGSFLLKQEIECLEFLKKHINLKWGWHGAHSNFFNVCKQEVSIVDSAPTGLVFINYFNRLTPKQFVDQCNNLIPDSINAVYLAINRYSFVAANDLNIEYDDDIGESIKQIVSHLKLPFVPLTDTPREVDGNHFVGAHGLDIFVYENS